MLTFNIFYKRVVICFLFLSMFLVSYPALLRTAQDALTDREFFIEVFNRSHSTFRASKTEGLRSPAVQGKKESFQSISENINLAKHYAAAEGVENPISNDFFNQAVAETKRLDDQEILMFTLTQRGFYYYRMRKISLAMPDFLEAMFLLDRNPNLNPPFAEEVYKQIGFFLGSIGDYKKGSQFLSKSLSLTSTSAERATINDNLGFYAVKSGDFSAAKRYFEEAWALALEANDLVRQAKVLGNKALIEQYHGRNDEAIRLLTADIAISRSNKADLNTLYASNLLAELLIDKGDYATALSYLMATKNFADTHENLIVHRETLNKHLLQIALHEQDEKAEIGLRRIIAGMQDSLNLFDGENVNNQARWLAEKEIINENLRVAGLKNSQDKQRFFYTLLGLSIVLILAFFFFLNYLSKRRKEEKQLYQDSLSEIEKERILLDQELANSQVSLHKKIESLEEKNRKVEGVLLSLKNSFVNDITGNAGLTTQNIGSSHLLTDENWNQFKLNFAAEYPDCYKQLRHNFPELSEGNLRVALLWKLKLSTKEIGQVLGVGMDAVKKSKQRLRRKMGDDRYQQLLDFMEAAELN